jgi:predicted metal-dependent TIM-barrel fold hydrolase
MTYIDPHIHMVSRTTDDYERMALAGCVAITEPAFWAGYDRSSAQGFYDYFKLLTEFEPRRAAQYGIRHHTWLCINPKEAEDPVFAREVLALIPSFLDREQRARHRRDRAQQEQPQRAHDPEEHLQLAATHNLLVLVHTPHLEDKLKGTRLIIDAIESASPLDPGRVLIDHVEEHTVRTCSTAASGRHDALPRHQVHAAARGGHHRDVPRVERLWINSAGDWGHSDPLAVPKCQIELRGRGHTEDLIRTISFDNPVKFLGQSGRFRV